MKPSDLKHSSLLAVLSGLLLVACGDTLSSSSALAGEPVGTTEAAVCGSAAVTTLTIAAVSTEMGEMAGNGSWAVSYPANAIRLEYYIDDVRYSYEDRPGTSGTWYFSAGGIACGQHTFKVVGYPMVIDSANNRTVCLMGFKTVTQTVPDGCACPSPSCDDLDMTFCKSGSATCYMYNGTSCVTASCSCSSNRYICPCAGIARGRRARAPACRRGTSARARGPGPGGTADYRVQVATALAAFTRP